MKTKFRDFPNGKKLTCGHTIFYKSEKSFDDDMCQACYKNANWDTKPVYDENGRQTGEFEPIARPAIFDVLESHGIDFNDQNPDPECAAQILDSLLTRNIDIGALNPDDFVTTCSARDFIEEILKDILFEESLDHLNMLFSEFSASGEDATKWEVDLEEHKKGYTPDFSSFAAFNKFISKFGYTAFERKISAGWCKDESIYFFRSF